MENRSWAQCLSTTELISELKTRAEDQRTEAALAVRRDEHCSPHAGAIHEDLADLLDETAVRMELVGLNYFKWIAKWIQNWPKVEPSAEQLKQAYIHYSSGISALESSAAIAENRELKSA